jgi:hypothetical protein
MAYARAAMNVVVMSIPVPVTWWSRAQVHSISPVPQARSSIRVPGGGFSAWPKVASLSLGERVVGAVAALADGKAARKVQFGISGGVGDPGTACGRAGEGVEPADAVARADT